ncbi:MAG: radical SAM protein [Selenomonadaceae bacterium]|nr:radical SAM protein [Selenomonadaceae bacterium]
MKIALVDVDSHNFPNLVLMKLSAWHKNFGDEVTLMSAETALQEENLIFKYDKIYGACVFSGHEEILNELEKRGVHLGGTGTRYREILPYEIEHIMPDYSLYGITDTAYGFLTRGCPRGCSFCLVGQKEGRKSYKVADVSEWWDGQENIKLIDPNLLACSEHLDLLKQLAETGAYVDITQGLDARLLTAKNIELINELKIKNLHFTWDNPRDNFTKSALENFKKLSKVKDRRKMIVYVLVNYWSNLKEDLYRIYWLRENGFEPYVMVYDKINAPKQITKMQRWVNNRRIFNVVKNFEDYDTRIG